jgi:hypothetical protein
MVSRHQCSIYTTFWNILQITKTGNRKVFRVFFLLFLSKAYNFYFFLGILPNLQNIFLQISLSVKTTFNKFLFNFQLTFFSGTCHFTTVQYTICLLTLHFHAFTILWIGNILHLHLRHFYNLMKGKPELRYDYEFINHQEFFQIIYRQNTI